MKCLHLLGALWLVAACKTTAPEALGDQATSSVDDVGVATDIATLGLDNMCRDFRGQTFDAGICQDLKNGQARPGTNTGVCRFYCDARNTCVSPFGSGDAMLAAVTKLQSYSMAIPNAVWSTLSVGERLREWLTLMLPWTQAQLLQWRPMLLSLQVGSLAGNKYTNALCAANVVLTLFNLLTELEKYAVGLDPAKRGDYDESSTTRLIAQLVCMASSVTASCAPQMKIPPSVALAATVTSAGCVVTTLVAGSIQCQQARDCCLASAYLGTGIATATLNEEQQLQRQCCRCTRKVWHDRTWPGSDRLLSTSPWGSVVTSAKGPVPECEMREGKTFYAAVPDEQGRWTYETYSDCRKELVAGDKCWQ